MSLAAIAPGFTTAAPSKHWSFEPVVRPSLPVVKNKSWVRNRIDRFVLAKLESRSWHPAQRADWEKLLRRIHLDLTGLPPSIAEQESFLSSPSNEHLDRRIDELLRRPAYGERWARHWLDVVRYAETNGYERDAAKPFVWRYRDYVIRAFNSDKPIDRFITEQLAGDELPQVNAETLIATGYHRLGFWDDEPADPETDRFDQLDDIVSTTSMAFLGLTLGCARCHDHKFDPLTSKDYYSMVAVFNPLQRPRNGRTELTLPIGSLQEIEVFTEREKQISKLEAEIAQFKKQNTSSSEGQEISKEENTRRAAPLEKQVAAIRKRAIEFPRGYFLHEPNSEPPVTHLLKRGNPSNPGPEVAPEIPSVLSDPQSPYFPLPKRTSGRRLALAKWIVSSENPLTARVWVNRVWQQHFGIGLVRTPNDFGTLGEKPTHPELLDWLAHWFINDAKWSLQSLHKLIMSSNAYRMGRSSEFDYSDADPEVRLLWRLPYRRLEVEAIRDSILAVSGGLNREMYGPSIYPSVPKQALEGHSDPDKIWKPFNESNASRRTVYAFIKRSMVVPMLEVLDLCDSTQSSPQRMVTTVAPQALTLFNGEFVNRQARRFSERLVKEEGHSRSCQIDLAYRLALCRSPSETEKMTMLDFLDSHTKRKLVEHAADSNPIHMEKARKRALEQMCRVIFNLNEFVYPD